MSVTWFLTLFINFYSFLNEFKPRIAKIQICETVKITKMIYSLSKNVIFVDYFTIYHIKKSFIFHRKAYKKNLSCLLKLYVQLHFSQ